MPGDAGGNTSRVRPHRQPDIAMRTLVATPGDADGNARTGVSASHRIFRHRH
jgi:hypothetical protein